MNVLEFIISMYIQVYMNFRQGWIRISSQGSEKLPECIKTNPICYQFWMKKEESSLAKKIQPNHANLVRNYLSFNRLKHAIFYLVFCFSETGIVCDQGVKIPTFSIFLFFMEFWQNEVRVGNRHAQSRVKVRISGLSEIRIYPDHFHNRKPRP